MGTVTVRKVALGWAPCSVCDKDVRLRLSDGTRTRRAPVGVHGPRGDRCPGSRQPGKTFMEYTGLSGWDGMSELDRGAALMFVWKVEWERSYRYARENYPARYVEDPLLVSLDDEDSCRHARIVTGGHREILAKLGNDEHQRLYNLALNAERAGA